MSESVTMIAIMEPNSMIPDHKSGVSQVMDQKVLKPSTAHMVIVTIVAMSEMIVGKALLISFQ